ncbi:MULTISPECIES: WD40 repeat domain-containing protein [Spirulina sp. CCY15215]|uniref:WD40 repeat domain-containing protein n=1 Tax=Spirulina sp. CCY15215 TaxID=2767591 RepID=UPI00194DCBBB|nr:WD40 repeat domain-containing protein [Spirulina major]
MKIFLFLSVLWIASFSTIIPVFADDAIAPEIEDIYEFNQEEETIPLTDKSIIKQWLNVDILHILEGHNAPIMSLAFSPDGQTLASGGSENDGSIYVWNVDSGRRIRRNRSQNGRVTAIAIAAEGELIISSSDVAGVSLWEWQNRNRKTNKRWILGHQNNVLSLAITPDSQVLISGGLDGIRVWDLRTMKPLYNLVRFELINALAIHPNGYILASGGQDGTIKLWNLRTGEVSTTIDAHTETIDALAFTPDGEILISGSHDRTIKLWRSATGQLLNTLVGHTGNINAIAVHPSGTFFASGSRDGIRLWNLETGELINAFTGHPDWIEALAFSPDGAILASGGFDDRIKLWHPVSPELINNDTE